MRKLITAIVIYLFVTHLHAQYQSNPWHLGFRLSPQFTWESTGSSNISAYGSKLNLSTAFVADYYLEENFSIGTEFSIGSFGGAIHLDSAYVTNQGNAAKNIELNYRLQYITIPLIFKYRTKEVDAISYYAEIGFGMGVCYRSKADIASSTVNKSNIDANHPDASDAVTFDYKGELSQKVNPLRISILVGVGVQYSTDDNTTLIAGIRSDNAVNNFTDESDWKTSMNYIAFHFGMLFNK